MPWSPIDVRSVSNFILDEADRENLYVSNLALQKLLYFAHGTFLIESKKPLVSGYFEAWQYGPVHPAAYMAFKEAGSNPIRFRAHSKNILTGEISDIPAPTDSDACRVINNVLNTLKNTTPGRLVEISHAPNAPWDYIVDKYRTSIAFGMRIPDNVILERFRFHMVAVSSEPRSGEPCEDAQFA